MNKRKARVNRAFVNAGTDFNNEIFRVCSDGYALVLGQCTNCGDLFLADLENPVVAGRSLAEIAGVSPCPGCGTRLAESLLSYPAGFVTRSGKVGQLSNCFPVEFSEESFVVDLWELQPATSLPPPSDAQP